MTQPRVKTPSVALSETRPRTAAPIRAKTAATARNRGSRTGKAAAAKANDASD